MCKNDSTFGRPENRPWKRLQIRRQCALGISFRQGHVDIGVTLDDECYLFRVGRQSILTVNGISVLIPIRCEPGAGPPKTHALAANLAPLTFNEDHSGVGRI